MDSNEMRSEWILAKVKRYFVCNPDEYYSGDGVLRVIAKYETEAVLDELTPDEIDYLKGKEEDA